MSKISEALTYGLTIRESATDGSDFTNPVADYRRLFLGEDGQLHVKDSAGAVTDIGAAAPAGAIVSKATATRTAGNVTLSGTSYANVDTGIDLVVAATAGDLLLIGLSAFWQAENDFGALDGATIVSGSPVNYISGNGSTGAGVMAWRGISLAYSAVGATVYYIVVGGDISGGNVTLRLRGKTGGGTNKVVRASSGEALTWYAVNLGQ